MRRLRIVEDQQVSHATAHLSERLQSSGLIWIGVEGIEEIGKISGFLLELVQVHDVEPRKIHAAVSMARVLDRLPVDVDPDDRSPSVPHKPIGCAASTTAHIQEAIDISPGQGLSHLGNGGLLAGMGIVSAAHEGQDLLPLGRIHPEFHGMLR
jgi:hypothetical protein